MKKFIRPVASENIAEECELYKVEMYNYLVSIYKGEISEEEQILYINSLIEEQDEMGFWGFVEPREVGADIRVLYFYEPTYIAVAIMMHYWNTHKGEVVGLIGFEEAFKKGLEAAIGRQFKGSGYDELKGIAQALKYLVYGNVVGFTCDYPKVCSRFTKQFEGAWSYLSFLFNQEETTNEWGEDFGPIIEETLTLLEEVRDSFKEKAQSQLNLFVYGTLKKGECNHHKYLSGASFEGNYYLDQYVLYELGSFPGMVPDEEGCVIGEVYCISPEQLKAIDELEGEGRLYKRQIVEVKSIKEDTPYKEVYTYVYLGDVQGKVKRDGQWKSKKGDKGGQK